MAKKPQYRIERMFESNLVSITVFKHADGSDDYRRTEEVCDKHAVHFVESGWFRLGWEKRDWLLGSGSIFLSQPGSVHRYDHLPHLALDTCISVRYVGEDASFGERSHRSTLP